MSEPFSNLPQLFSDAYQWLCRSRKNHPPDSDIWSLKCTWNRQAEEIIESFRIGKYLFDVQAKITLSCGKTIERFKERIARLYEQDTDSKRIGEYVKRWIGWAKAGHLGAGNICRAVLVEKILPYNTNNAEILFNSLSIHSSET